MTIEITLTESDFLTHQLFIASQSDRIAQKRRKNHLLVPLAYGIIAIAFWRQERLVLAIAFVVIALLWWIVYPIWDKQRYRRHYRQFIQEHYKDRTEKPATLELTDTHITARESGSESRVQTSEIKEIVELPTLLLLRLDGGQSFLIPTSHPDISAIRDWSHQLALQLGIPYHNLSGWQWR